MSCKLKLVIKILSPLFLILLLTSCGALAGVSGIKLDPSRVEGIIEDGVLEQGGFYVVASCPNPLVGEIGETRTCTIEDEYGETALVDVTIQNAVGEIIWQVRE